MAELKFKIWQNKANDQFNMVIPKRLFPQLRNKNPKTMKIRGEVEFLD